MSRHAVTLEKMGIPVAACTGRNVIEYLKGWDKLYCNGAPLRFTVFPLPVAGVSRAVHEKYLAGNDPVTGRPIIQEIIECLTLPLQPEEQLTGLPAGAVEPRTLTPDTEDNLQELFRTNDWTDYLPVILPTQERVEAMLKGTSHQPDEVVKTLTWPGGGRQLTVEKAAVHAVMAGAKPQYFPTILALATLSPYGNSTTSMANIIIVNGPVRNEIGMNCGAGAFSPYNGPNATIGRSFTLLSRGAGNLHAGKTAFCSLGNNLQYNNCCIAENEEELPEGWNPLSVQFGYKRDDSVVTVGIGWTCISCVGEVEAEYPANMLMRDYMKSLSALGSAALVCADPLVAKMLHDHQGFNSKESLARWFSKNVKVPAHQFWGNGLATSFYSNLALQGLEPYATWKKVPEESLIEPFTNPRGINTVVVGGQMNTIWFVTDFRVGKGVLIDTWR
ncbi:MAG: hypothetical protein JXA46_06470 [Dehalococcoidales bacterium]|nr:hypothetical protein [Dehalococcoidales bacterium]